MTDLGLKLAEVVVVEMLGDPRCPRPRLAQSMKAAEFPVAGKKVTAFWPHYSSNEVINRLRPAVAYQLQGGRPIISKKRAFLPVD